MERAVDFQLQSRSDCLHADNTTKPGEGIPKIGMHLAVLDEVLFALQWHFADPTRARVQALAVSYFMFR